MTALFVNPRLEYLLRAAPFCPACRDTRQQQILNTWTDPASWKCRFCRREYRWEPEGTPSLDVANAAIVATFPPIGNVTLEPQDLQAHDEEQENT